MEEGDVVRAVYRRDEVLASHAVGLLFYSEVIYRFVGERKGECASLSELPCGDEETTQLLPIQTDGSDIGILCGILVCGNGELALRERQGHLPEAGGGDLELSACRCHRIETEGSEEIPGRHLTAVLIAADPLRSVVVQFIKDLTRQLLGAGGATQVIVKVGEVMARLIAMSILPDKTGDVLEVSSRCGIAKEIVESVKHLLCSAVESNHPLHIVHGCKTVLPAIGFGVVLAYLVRVKVSSPRSILLTSTEKLGASVEEMDVIVSSLVVGVCNLFLPECLRHPSDAPVIISVLEGAGDGLVVRIGGNESQSGVGIGAFLVDIRRLDHSLEHLHRVEVAKLSAEVGISQYGDGVVTDHGSGLATVERPDGKLALLTVHLHHGSAQIRHHFRVEQSEERMLRTEGVPERQSGVTHSGGMMDLIVHTAIASVGITCSIRRYEGVVEGGVEASEIFPFSFFYLYLGEKVIPLLLCAGTDLAECLAGP